MSINQFSSELQVPTLWWAHHLPAMETHPPPSGQTKPFWNLQLSHCTENQKPTWLSLNSQEHTSKMGFNFSPNSESSFGNHESSKEPLEGDLREPMFEKPLTPSDVGKLNRLVIPKHHAEKYFPLGGCDSAAEKGLLLSFEDESGKSWRFRYSYWNSSQSYVLTKGWSRFVKEKNLDAGDVVFFLRHRTDADRLFIGWRRQNSGAMQESVKTDGILYPAHPSAPANRGHRHLPRFEHQHCQKLLQCQPDCLHNYAGVPLDRSQTTPPGHSKVLRLFGVDMECQTDESSEQSMTSNSSLLSQDPRDHHPFYPQSYSISHPNHMPEFMLTGDGNQMRTHRI